jgi:putative FmdB family regulatory protein
MPIHEYRCPQCDQTYEAIQIGSSAPPACPFCGAANGEKLLSAPSVVGPTGHAMPGAKDHGCCGERPGQSGCRPGSCCGRA